jgi:predicted nucleotidyltransferase
MDRNEALQLLSQHRAEITREFGVSRLALFGSTARDEANADSDIDVLVSFDGGATLRRYMGLNRYLETLFNRRVDLVTDKSLRQELRPYVEQDLVDVA